MDGLLVAASVLAFLAGAAHSVLGERFLLGPLLRRDDLELLGSSSFGKHTLRYGWHLTSVAWWGFALLLYQIAPESGDVRAAVLVTTSLTFLASATLSAILTRGRHVSWVAFLLIAVFCAWRI